MAEVEANEEGKKNPLNYVVWNSLIVCKSCNYQPGVFIPGAPSPRAITDSHPGVPPPLPDRLLHDEHLTRSLLSSLLPLSPPALPQRATPQGSACAPSRAPGLSTLTVLSSHQVSMKP